MGGQPIPGSHPVPGSQPIPGSQPVPPVGTPGGYSPRNPAPRPMRAGVWSLIADTLFGVVVLTLVTTYWGSYFGMTLMMTVPVMATIVVGLIWATGAAARGPWHVALPAALVLLAVILTGGNGLISLLPDSLHPMVVSSRVGGMVYGSTGLLFAALGTVILAAGAGEMARRLGYRAESIELSRVAAIRRSARSHHEGNPYAEAEEAHGRTPPPTRIFAHLGAGIGGAVLAFLAFWWYGSALDGAPSSVGFAVTPESVVLLVITGAAVLLGCLSAWGPVAAAIVTYLVPPVILDGGVLVGTLDGASASLFTATTYGYHYVMVPILAICAETVRSARNSGRVAARNPGE